MEERKCKKCGTTKNVNFDGMCKNCYEESVTIKEEDNLTDKKERAQIQINWKELIKEKYLTIGKILLIIIAICIVIIYVLSKNNENISKNYKDIENKYNQATEELNQTKEEVEQLKQEIKDKENNKEEPREQEKTLNTTTNQIENVQTTEKGTSAKVDEIAKQAKVDANNINNSTKEEAIIFIKNNKNNFYKDIETMEKAMYYGYLLEYAFENTDKNLAKLGQDVYQAIKYVYRGAESVEDEATQENLRQIEKDLQTIN